MPRTDNELSVTPSVLDRLLDFEPKTTTESPKTRSSSLKELKESVKRDLEWLLNTRSYPVEIDENAEEIKKSVIAYGLPDITTISIKNPNERKRLIKAIESAIKTFEPRFTNLSVFLDHFSDSDKSLNFRIEARLDVEPSPEPISFDTVLQVGSSEFSVTER